MEPIGNIFNNMQETNLNTSDNLEPIPQEPITLPEDGTRVKAITLPSLEYDRGEEEIEGELFKIESPFGEPPNTFVNGIAVEPSSIEVIASQSSQDAPQSNVEA